MFERDYTFANVNCVGGVCRKIKERKMIYYIYGKVFKTNNEGKPANDNWSLSHPYIYTTPSCRLQALHS